jgi:sec-independent protein translocase protein TatC
MESEKSRKNNDSKPFLDHLEDLRWTLLKIIASLIIGIILTSFFVPQILSILKRPLFRIQAEMNLPDTQISLVALRPGEGLINLMKIAVFSGIVVSLPAAMYFLMRFAMPAMTTREKTVIIPGLGAGLGLFIAGLCFCYFITMPLMVRMMWKINASFGLQNAWTLSYYLSFVTGFMLANGLVFELPLVLLILVKLDILSVKLLRKGRRHAIVIMFIIGGILTPPDPFTIFLVALPMIFLYEACIWVSVLTTKKNI